MRAVCCLPGYDNSILSVLLVVLFPICFTELVIAHFSALSFFSEIVYASCVFLVMMFFSSVQLVFCLESHLQLAFGSSVITAVFVVVL